MYFKYKLQKYLYTKYVSLIYHINCKYITKDKMYALLKHKPKSNKMCFTTNKKYYKKILHTSYMWITMDCKGTPIKIHR